MKSLDAKKFFWVLIGVNALLVGATIVVFVQASAVAEKKSQKIAEYKAEDQANDQLIGQYKALEISLNSNKDLESLLHETLPSDKDQSSALVDLDQFSKSSGVTIDQISFLPGQSKAGSQGLVSPSGINGVSVISVSLGCKTTPYENLLSFLRTIESTRRRMQVTSLNITPNNTNPSQLDRVDMTIDIYLKSESK